MSEITTIDILVRLVTAALLGAAIGLEREYRKKPAGVRTDILVAVGTAVIAILSVEIARFTTNAASVNISQIVSQVLPGIGFIGAGSIIQSKGRVEGLTTAASIWLVAAVGMAAGLGLFTLAVLAAALGIISLLILHAIKLPESEPR